MDLQHQDPEIMLRNYIYDYLLKKNLHATAQAFKNEVNISDELMEILDDYHSNFLLDWWSIFSDSYFQKQSSGESQGTIQKEFILEPFKTSNKQDLWLQSLIMHPNMTPQGASLLQSNNSILHYFPLMRSQENERQHTLMRQFASIDETRPRQHNFFRDMQHDRRSRSTPTYHLGQVQHLNIDGFLQMGSKHSPLVTSLPMELCGQDKLIGWPHSVIDPTFSSVRQKGINPPLSTRKGKELLHSSTKDNSQSGDSATSLTPITSCGAPTSGINFETFGIAEKTNMDNFEEDNEDISKLLNELVGEQVKENNGNSVESQSFAEEGAGDNNTKAQHLGIGEKVSSNVDKEYIKGTSDLGHILTREESAFGKEQILLADIHKELDCVTHLTRLTFAARQLNSESRGLASRRVLRKQHGLLN
ncbi:uncharacterized protein [Elaeis guineensis]|uniref:uncharacterized protein n=1 Tax=Elaeis guineensis var. tenera TaxID=51953 RepID=UPI003C6D8011